MIDLVIYHADCMDGFCAAWICHKVWRDAEYYPCQYGMEPPDVTGKNVIVVDFSFKRDVLLRMKEKANSLLVLDHHKTAEADLAGLDFCKFDMNKSGARLMWEHIHDLWDTPAPWLVDYTEDRDLWRHQLPFSKEINASLRTWPMEFNYWDAINNGVATDHIESGATVLRYQKMLVDSHVKRAQEIEFGEHKVLSVNATCLISEIAGELAKDRPFGVCWFETDRNQRVFSLRSSPSGVDVSEVALSYGGGGHKHAAGFSVPVVTSISDYFKTRKQAQPTMNLFDDAPTHLMRSQCKFGCQTDLGYIVTKGGQDSVYCQSCQKFQYNAPRSETVNK